MNKYLHLFFLILIFPVFAHGTDETLPPRFRLAYVGFNGVEHVSKNDLKERLAARMPPLWKVWLPRPVLTAADVEDDRLRIRQFYQEYGYYHTEVDVAAEVVHSETASDKSTEEVDAQPLPGVTVAFDVAEGPPVVISSVEVRVRPPIAGISETDIKRALPLQPERVFTRPDYEASKARATRFLATRGYPFAAVTGKARVDIVKDRADIVIDVNGGPLCRFGTVNIDQAENPVEEQTIRRGLTFQENEIYDLSKIESSRANLIKLNVFRLVVFEPGGPPEKDSGPVGLKLRLRSKERHGLQAGIGYGSEDKLRLQGAWTYRNVFGYAGNSTVTAKYSDLIESINLAFDQPYFWDEKTRYYANSGYEKEKFASYTNRKVLIETGVARHLWQDITGTVGYGLAYNDVENIDLVAFEDDELESFEEQNRFLVSSLFSQLVRDTRLNKINPTQGSLVAGSFEWASRLLGSELQYIKPALEGRIYHSFFKNLVGTARLRLETIQEIEDSDFIPINKRLFLGGGNTVRGYDFQEVPPLDAAGNPVGGRTALNTNLELRFPVYEALSGVVFLDTGLIDPNAFRLALSDTWYTCGLGIRYDTIIGPLRIDWGYKINPPTGQDIGDADDPDEIVGERWRLHFSIGQAF